MQSDQSNTKEEETETTNVFIKFLPSDVNDSGLHALFSPFGEIVSCKVMVDTLTGASLGYGFCRFSTPESATLAIEEMNGMKYKNKTLLCKLSNPTINKDNDQPQDNLYVRPLLRTTTEGDLIELFSPFGFIKDCKVMINKSTGVSRQIGFVRFEKLECAIAALKALNGHQLEKDAPGLIVKFAETTNQKTTRKSKISANQTAAASRMASEAGILPNHMNINGNAANVNGYYNHMNSQNNVSPLVSYSAKVTQKLNSSFGQSQPSQSQIQNPNTIPQNPQNQQPNQSNSYQPPEGFSPISQRRGQFIRQQQQQQQQQQNFQYPTQFQYLQHYPQYQFRQPQSTVFYKTGAPILNVPTTNDPNQSNISDDKKKVSSNENKENENNENKKSVEENKNDKNEKNESKPTDKNEIDKNKNEKRKSDSPIKIVPPQVYNNNSNPESIGLTTTFNQVYHHDGIIPQPQGFSSALVPDFSVGNNNKILGIPDQHYLYQPNSYSYLKTSTGSEGDDYSFDNLAANRFVEGFVDEEGDYNVVPNPIPHEGYHTHPSYHGLGLATTFSPEFGMVNLPWPGPNWSLGSSGGWDGRAWESAEGNMSQFLSVGAHVDQSSPYPGGIIGNNGFPQPYGPNSELTIHQQSFLIHQGRGQPRGWKNKSHGKRNPTKTRATRSNDQVVPKGIIDRGGIIKNIQFSDDEIPQSIENQHSTNEKTEPETTIIISSPESNQQSNEISTDGEMTNSTQPPTPPPTPTTESETTSSDTNQQELLSPQLLQKRGKGRGGFGRGQPIVEEASSSSSSSSSSSGISQNGSRGIIKNVQLQELNSKEKYIEQQSSPRQHSPRQFSPRQQQQQQQQSYQPRRRQQYQPQPQNYGQNFNQNYNQQNYNPNYNPIYNQQNYNPNYNPNYNQQNYGQNYNVNVNYQKPQKQYVQVSKSRDEKSNNDKIASNDNGNQNENSGVQQTTPTPPPQQQSPPQQPSPPQQQQQQQQQQPSPPQQVTIISRNSDKRISPFLSKENGEK